MNQDKNKKVVGVLLSIFLGLIGLIIGLCLYPYNSEERKTFLNGWLLGLVISLLIGVVFVIIYFCFLSSIINSVY